jgi:NAD(P)-dependent dehydrogenase (short-subunit alcohol dehydrogenase family)
MRSALFDLSGRVAIITGGAGLLGEQHARIVADAGGTPVLLDVNGHRAKTLAAALAEEFGVPALGIKVDIVQRTDVEQALKETLESFGRVDILINNATNNPKVQQSSSTDFSRFESFPMDQWASDIDVGLTGAFLCSQVFGVEMARRATGVILNVASDLALIGPDQRLYRQPGLADEFQPVKPVTYSVVKSALIGLTRYLATYWADRGVRVNAICPGGVYDGQPPEFVAKITSLIPMGRMAAVNEYQGAILFLVSDASSYMTGASLVVDGGRTCW